MQRSRFMDETSRQTRLSGLFGNDLKINKRSGKASDLACGRRNGTLTPDAYVMAFGDAVKNAIAKDQTAYFTLCDFMLRARGTLNSLATTLGCSLSERAYLAALVDLLILRPEKTSGGNFIVQMLATDAAAYIGLSQSTCTTVRRSLTEKGIISVDSELIDLAPLMLMIKPILNGENTFGSPTGGTLGCQNIEMEAPKFGSLSPTVKSRLDSKKLLTVCDPQNSAGVEEVEEPFSRQEALKAIGLSEKISSCIEKKLGMEYGQAPFEAVLQVMPLVAEDLLESSIAAPEPRYGTKFSCRTAWFSQWKLNGLAAFAALFSAVENSEIRKRSNWFFKLGRDRVLNARALIEDVLAQRRRAAALQAEREKAERAAEMRVAEKDKQASLARKALEILKRARSEEIFSGDVLFWSTAPDHIQVIEKDNRVIFGIRPYKASSLSPDQRNSTLWKIVEHIGRTIAGDRWTAVNGCYPGVQTISAFGKSC